MQGKLNKMSRKIMQLKEVGLAIFTFFAYNIGDIIFRFERNEDFDCIQGYE